MKKTDFQRGAIAAASFADSYNSTSTHPYRIGDCVLINLDIRKQKPRLNKGCPRNEHDAWMVGFATALAEMHRRLCGGNDSTGVREVARSAGFTIKSARAAGASVFDLKELKKAGVP